MVSRKLASGWYKKDFTIWHAKESVFKYLRFRGRKFVYKYRLKKSAVDVQLV